MLGSDQIVRYFSCPPSRLFDPSSACPMYIFYIHTSFLSAQTWFSSSLLES